MTQSSELKRTGEIRLYQPGQSIDGYQVVEVLGHGGMGAVYRVTRENREYALKVMLKENLDVHDLAHFEREAQATAAIRHPNVVAVHSLQLNSATPYILFDYVRGQSLDHFIDEPWTLEQLIPFLRPVAEALDHIHEQGLIHRDLKPANIIAREHDRCPLLADFGLARGGSLESLTQTGMVKGTPSFMAPEQLQGLKVGPGVDLWAFAVMTYQFLSGGTLPFTGENPIALASAVMLKEAPAVSKVQEGLSEVLDAVFAKAFAKDAEDRYESVVAFLEDCERARIGEPILGQAPARYKGAIRSFHAGGAKAAFKLLTGIALIGALVYLAFLALERKKTQDWFKATRAAIGKPIGEKKFRKDFCEALAQHLIEKMQLRGKSDGRPDYVFVTSKLVKLYEEVSLQEIEPSDKKKLLGQISSSLTFSKTWDCLESLDLAKYRTLTPSQIKDQKRALKSAKKGYRELLIAGHHFYLEQWADVRPAFENLEEAGEFDPATALFRALIAYKMQDDGGFRKEAGAAESILQNGELNEMLEKTELREIAQKLVVKRDSSLLLKKIEKWSESTELTKSKGFAELNRILEGKMREQSANPKLGSSVLVSRYDAYFNLRKKQPRLRPWPLGARLLKALIQAAETHKDKKRAFLYSYLLYQKDKNANLAEKVPLDKFGRPRLDPIALEAYLEGANKSKNLKGPGADGGERVNVGLFNWLLLFSRYGLRLSYGSSEGARKFKKAGIIAKLLKENERDPLLRFWRGFARESDEERLEVDDVKKRLRKRLPGSEFEAKKVWRYFAQSERDIEYALKFGPRNKSFRAIMLRRLVSIRQNKIRLGIAENPNLLKEEGLALLSSIKNDHPHPYSVMKTMAAVATVDKRTAEIPEQLLGYTDERERLLLRHHDRRKKFESGELLRLTPYRSALKDDVYNKELAGCYSSRAYAYNAMKRYDDALKALVRSTDRYFSYSHCHWYYKELTKRSDVSSLLVLKRAIAAWTGRLKERNNEDEIHAAELLNAITKTINELQPEKN